LTVPQYPWVAFKDSRALFSVISRVYLKELIDALYVDGFLVVWMLVTTFFEFDE